MLVASKGNTDLLTFNALFWGTIGLCLSAGGANTVNMWYDKDIDAIMKRTQNRPLPAGRMTPKTVLFLGVFWGIFAHALLTVMVNPLTAWMATTGYLFYVFIYTMFLKRRTVQNIVIGGAAGAVPPVVGWAAVQNDVSSWMPWAMFLVIFLWTPPHFWALALKKREDYSNANIPMLPCVKGDDETKVQIVYYMLILIPVTLSLALSSHLGFIYLISASILGGIWLYKGYKLMHEKGIESTMDVFMFSLYYLAILFAAMVVDTFI
jgi:protoheme IX farnesyltransferase